MALVDCPECGHRVSEEAVTCPNCGHPIKRDVDPISSRPAFGASWPLIVVLGGAGAIALGSFLPWVSIQSIFGTFSASGMEGDGILTLFAGLFLAIIGAVALGRRSASWVTAALILLIAAVSGLISFNVYTNLLNAVGLGGESVVSSIGAGLWLVILGSAVAFGAGVSVLATRDGQALTRSASGLGVTVGLAVAAVFVIAVMALGSQVSGIEISETFSEVSSGLDQ